MPSEEVSDPWDQQPTRSAGPSARPRDQVIPDAWDDDDDDDDAPIDPEMNKKIWEEANTKTPMPEVVAGASTATGLSATFTPPTAAFQPQLRILKRPSASPAATSVSSLAGTKDSIHEREARYNAARERIFGAVQALEPEGVSTSPGVDTGRDVERKVQSATRQSDPRVFITRSPRGPSDYPDGSIAKDGNGATLPRGFGRRIGDNKPPQPREA